jgi:Tfp pilus assembly protein PilP
MRNKLFILIVLLVFCIPIFFFAQEKDKPLIRKDLLIALQKKNSEFSKGRNIFSWKLSLKKLPQENESNKKLKRERLRESLGKENRIENQIRTKIKYVGYVSSRKKILGIIILGREERVVEVGEIIENIGKINKITPKEIEILSLNSKLIKIPLEEEEEFIF